MQKRLKQIQSYLSNADVKGSSFIFYCLCVELLEIIEELLTADKTKMLERA